LPVDAQAGIAAHQTMAARAGDKQHEARIAVSRHAACQNLPAPLDPAALEWLRYPGDVIGGLTLHFAQALV
jgi:hypothetical protein